MISGELKIIGASSTITPEGDSTACIHLSVGGNSFLIDCGGNIPALLREQNLDHTSLDGVIITHSHPDHAYGLPFLSHSFYNSCRSIKLWSVKEALPRLKKSLEAYDLREEGRYLEIDFKEVSSKKTDRIQLTDEFSIKTLPTNHSRPGIGLKINTESQKIVYSSDSAPAEEIVSSSRGADVLIHDCQGTEAYSRYFKKSHTSARQLGNIARKSNVSALVPFHYNTTEIPVSFSEIAAEIREEYGGTIIQAKKGTAFYF